MIGDTRHLDFHLYKQDRKKKMSEIEEEEGRHFFDLEHGTLFLLHPKDEQPFDRAWCPQNGLTFFKHSSQGVGKGKGGNISLGIAMRVICHYNEVVFDSGRLILKDEFFPKEKQHESINHWHSETILQDYLAKREQKKSDETELMNKWKKCLEDYFLEDDGGATPTL